MKNFFNYFIETLNDSIFTWDYFVDFYKVVGNVESVRNELTILNELIGLNPDDFDKKAVELVTEHPSVRKALPILIALRLSKIKNTPIVDDIDTMVAVNKKELFDPKVPMNKQLIKDLHLFFEKSGLKDFLITNKINNLIDFCLGIEVGMDTHSRKSRTGESMENIVEKFLMNFCLQNNFRFLSQATKNKIEDAWNYQINDGEINRRFDFAIISPENQLTLIEVNFYSTGGSKLKATAGEYKALQKLLSDQSIRFIWITDGKGWNTAKAALFETIVTNDYTFNLEMLKNGILNEVLQNQIFTLKN